MGIISPSNLELLLLAGRLKLVIVLSYSVRIKRVSPKIGLYFEADMPPPKFKNGPKWVKS